MDRQPELNDLSPREAARMLNESIVDGWAVAMGVTFVEASAEKVVAELDVADQHVQPYGIVHGGVHSGLIETLASTGAALFAMRRGLSVVGLENHTTVVKAARKGRLRAVAEPILRGRRTQVWEGSVFDEHEQLLSTGRVRLICLEPEAELAGGEARVPGMEEPARGRRR